MKLRTVVVSLVFGFSVSVAQDLRPLIGLIGTSLVSGILCGVALFIGERLEAKRASGGEL